MLFTKSKKANLEDIPLSIIFMLVIVISVFIAAIILDQYNTKFQTMNVTNTTEAREAVTKFNNRMYVAWDYAIPLILLGFVLFSVMAARFIPTHPTYIVVGILFLILIPFVGMVVGNMYDDMVLKSVWISNMDSKMPMTAYIMDHLLIISILYTAIVVYVLYSRRGQDAPAV
jgi:hypothetical protein